MNRAMVHPTSIVEPGAVVGAGSKVWHFCHVQRGAVVGHGCVLGQNVYLGAGVRIGDGCKLQNNVSLYQGVTLEEGVFCGPSCVFTNDLTPRALFPKGSGGYMPTRVCRGASIGANATVVCGHTVGRWAMVAAGAVVTRDVRPHALVAGVPARRVGWVCCCGTKLDDHLGCPRCGRRYRPGLVLQK